MWGGFYFEDPHDNVTERLNKLEERAHSLRNLKVLDVGCGRGNISFALSIRCSKVVGIDIKRTNIYEAKTLQEMHKTRIPHKVNFLVADALHLPFREGVFDVVVLSDLLEHLYDDKRALIETHKVLKTRGTILVTVPNRWQLIEHHVKFPLLGFLPAMIQSKKIGTNKWVKRLYTKQELLSLFSTYFYELYVGYVWPNFDCTRKKRKRLGSLLKKMSNIFSKTLLHFLGTSLIYIGSKRVC